jgi:23S rRNA (cytidine1920-2'-O)/16S rRNA (cytidine1409-2'-O)-methyltransferase
VKKRLDVLVTERGLAPTREKARRLVMAGAVTVEGRVVDKAGHPVDDEAVVAVRDEGESFVGRGGLKLSPVLDEAGVDPSGAVAMDVGASTGGFTDCLLRRGARRVYAVDVGYGQLDSRLRSDPRVTVMERTNIRHLPKEAVPEAIDLATVDTSFISLRLVLPPVVGFLRPGGEILALVKPQFELGRGEVGRGVVRDEAKRERAVAEVAEAAREMGLDVVGVHRSPITGAKGNVEFFIHLRKGT